MKVVAVRVAASNSKRARLEHILHRVGDVGRVARIVDQSGKRSGDRPARSASESKITPLSEERRPPSNAAVTFLRDTAGKE